MLPENVPRWLSSFRIRKNRYVPRTPIRRGSPRCLKRAAYFSVHSTVGSELTNRSQPRMSPELLQMVTDGDEVALERAYFDNECPHFFAVDWREDDADIVAYCAEALQ